MARTLNRVQLIGHLGADPEMRYTSAGMPVTTFSLATNRQWTSKDGAPQEETDWHNIIAWDKLAQLCSEYLSRGRLVYIEGRIHTRSWESNGQKQYKTEIVASDMLILDSKNNSEPQQDTERAGEQELAGPHREKNRPSEQTEVAASRPTASRSPKPPVIAELEDSEELPF